MFFLYFFHFSRGIPNKALIHCILSELDVFFFFIERFGQNFARCTAAACLHIPWCATTETTEWWDSQRMASSRWAVTESAEKSLYIGMLLLGWVQLYSRSRKIRNGICVRFRWISAVALSFMKISCEILSYTLPGTTWSGSCSILYWNFWVFIKYSWGDIPTKKVLIDVATSVLKFEGVCRLATYFDYDFFLIFRALPTSKEYSVSWFSDERLLSLKYSF
jgi:hypothetical protein